MYRRLWAYVARATQEPHLAEDIAQEAFIRLLSSRGATLPPDERRAYLFRIAENLVRDAARRRKRERPAPLDQVPEPAAPEAPEPMSRRAAAALASLGARERRLLWLAHVEGWRHAEIARLLGIATASVRVLLHRARRRFRERLDSGDRP